jgi:hypothetical protein
MKSKQLTYCSVEEAVKELGLKGNFKSFCGYLYQWTTDPRPKPIYVNGYMVKIVMRKLKH